MMTVITDTNRVHYIRYLHFVDMATAEIKIKKKYHTIGTVTKPHIKFVERGKIETPYTYT